MNAKGFTLIELLIVVAIIGIIAAIAIPNLLVALQKGKQKATMGDMTSIGQAVESYITDWSFAPAAGGTSVTDLDQPWFRAFYIKILPVRDSWGTIFEYAAGTGDEIDLYSITSWGRDKADGDMPAQEYDVTSLFHFNNDITYSCGHFTVGPRVRK